MPLKSVRARIAAYKARVRYAGKAARAKARSYVPSRRPSGRRAMSLQKYNVHMYKRMATAQLFTATSGATAYNNVLTFDLSQVRGASELTALYDQYMIVGVKVTFHMVTNPDSEYRTNQTANANASNFYPKLFYCRDYDNDTVEATNDLRERNNTKFRILQPNKAVSVYLRPAVRNQVYLDGITPANSPIWNQWLDCSVSTVPHYGLKYSLDFLGLTSANDYNLRIEETYYLKFKNTR